MRKTINVISSLGKPFGFPLLFIFLSTSLSAQYLEFGGGIGAANYSGEATQFIDPPESRPSFTLVFRKNENNYFSYRATATVLWLQITDGNAKDDFENLRNISTTTTLGEVAVAAEYYFLDYKGKNALVDWSPYAFAGVGAFIFLKDPNPANNKSPIQPVIPFGVGVKKLIGKQWSFAVEFGARKTFTDELDGISDATIPERENYQHGTPYLDDWYYNLGITFTYTIFTVPCPFDYN